MPMCPTCGHNQPGNARICLECGMELRPPSPPSPSLLSNPNSSGKTIDLFKRSTPRKIAAVVEPPLDAPVEPQRRENGATNARLCYKRAGQLTSDEFPVSSPSVIGRFDVERGPVDVDLDSLPDADYIARHISRKHAEIRETSPGNWVISDLGSANGTFVRPVGQADFHRLVKNKEYPLRDGDEISFGNVKFEFHPS